MILCKIDEVTAPGIAGDTTLSSSSNSEQPHALSNVFHTTRSGNTLEERSVCVKVKKSLTKKFQSSLFALFRAVINVSILLDHDRQIHFSNSRSIVLVPRSIMVPSNSVEIDFQRDDDAVISFNSIIERYINKAVDEENVALAQEVFGMPDKGQPQSRRRLQASCRCCSYAVPISVRGIGTVRRGRKHRAVGVGSRVSSFHSGAMRPALPVDDHQHVPDTKSRMGQIIVDNESEKEASFNGNKVNN
ncbi:hypothetical protein HZH66_010200 [Vespula vulgaris]|uniref:Uncharacterized protein n=1 Tax=Vespula vulgaris TaxID=7454 RepID=A0A834JII7_VESVU|nr:hypothetical protein HZH66_010200 [Vespula vulgaris]